MKPLTVPDDQRGNCTARLGRFVRSLFAFGRKVRCLRIPSARGRSEARARVASSIDRIEKLVTHLVMDRTSAYGGSRSGRWGGPTSPQWLGPSEVEEGLGEKFCASRAIDATS